LGGYGSGRWGWHSKATIVEDYLQLDTRHLKREKLLGWGLHWSGAWLWKRGEEVTSSIGLEVDTTDRARPWVRLFYELKRSGQEVDYKIALQTTRPALGGDLWWFTCPAQGCGRRVRKLYLPPGAVHFACRHCYHLTYRSCQESHIYDSLFGRIGAKLGYSADQVARLLRVRWG